MSQREGHAVLEAVPNRTAVGSPPPSVPDWEVAFPTLATERQETLLDLARQQGFLLADQVPADPSPRPEFSAVLRLALRHQLSPLGLATPVTPFDTTLDADQVDAVARAVATPDLFLVEGPPGTGKTAVAVELVRQLHGRSLRSLVVVPDGASADRFVRRLMAVPGITLELWCDPTAANQTEFPALTPQGRLQSACDRLARRAADAVQAAESQAQAARSRSQHAKELAAVRSRRDARATERAALATRQASLGDEITREAEAAGEPAPYFVQRLRGVSAGLAKRLAALDATAAEFQAARAVADEKRRAAEAETAALRPLLDARRKPWYLAWLSTRYWEARGDATLDDRLAKAEENRAQAMADLQAADVADQKLAADRKAAQAEAAAERERHIQNEVTRRQQEIEQALSALAQADGDDATQEAALTAALAGPAAGSPDALDRELGVIREWQSRVQTEGLELARQTLESPAVVVATPGAIGCSGAGRGFDYAIIDEADGLDEVEWTAACQSAPRWALFGRHGRGAKADHFGRLAAALAFDTWAREGNRLVCRLHAIRGGDRRRLECEPVADATDVELRLFTPEAGDPVLAEVAFSGSVAVATAREYLQRELGEVTCQPRHRVPQWQQTPDGLVLRFQPPAPAATFAVIGDGVREELAGLDTAAVWFSPPWTRDQAEAWAAESIARPSATRHVRLAAAHRACPGLADWLNRAFHVGYREPILADERPHVEFLAVPDMEPRRRKPSREQGRSGRIGGAGYETDLADRQQRAAIAGELTDLPPHGLVNVPEAQAIVRYLETVPTTGWVVTSPFPAQVEVLRKLLGKSGRLPAVRAGDAGQLAGHECEVLIVSLTRSHVSRAVPFGDSPATLERLLHTARKKVIFAGDPGTLARRLQWEGPVEHLDAAAAALERAWVAALADCPRVPHFRHRAPAESARS